MYKQTHQMKILEVKNAIMKKAYERGSSADLR